MEGRTQCYCSSKKPRIELPRALVVMMETVQHHYIEEPSKLQQYKDIFEEISQIREVAE